jgi:uncharacterized protein (UPF0276 family)
LTYVGLGHCGGLAAWIASAPAEVECVEVTAEAFYKGGRGLVHGLRDRVPLLVRTRRLSLGTPGPVDPDELAWSASFVREAQPLWMSDALGFRCSSEVDLAASVPVALTDETLDLLVDHARVVTEACGVPLLLENIASRLAIAGTMREPAFLNRFCDRSGCGLALDVTALAVAGRNHRFDPVRWIEELDPRWVVQLHVGGCRERDGGWHDAHDAPLDDEVLGLTGFVMERAAVRAVVLLRNGRFPPIDEIVADLRRLKSLARPGGAGTG